ncbi:class I SAM-dependent methyltransferase [Mesorhizobium sp. Z1-4]|uniref:class I SAM-dependent methyltransferase n=1 Tax=Mesorhizobium sp. Z1-4 TaxID=2448478 RepID=UPI000FDB67DB|nr:class I SAM-dependent methyltransferase [Mesorhizobium sp. Z1-4]
MTVGDDQKHWSRFAREWIDWARSPDHDAFWAYQSAFAEFVGAGSGELLDIGCGEGRVARTLKPLGYRITAVDAVAELVDAAKGAESAADYIVAPATDLPFATGSFDTVISYNMLMDVEDLPAAVREFRRVLRDDGTLVISIVHPLADLQTIGAGDNYFERRKFETEAKGNGLTMHFSGWTQSLERYASALEAAGLGITSLREPLPEITPAREHLAQWQRLPLFLWMKARVISG